MNNNDNDIEENCPECKGNDVVENWKDGTKVCRSCGFVLRKRLYDKGEEWRRFEEDGEYTQERAGPSSNNLQEHEEATDIGKKRCRGDGVTACNVIRARKRQKKEASSKADRLTEEAMFQIDYVCSALELTEAILSMAKGLYGKYKELLTRKADKSDSNKAIRGRRFCAKRSKEIAASSIFLACRLHRVPRTFSEMSGVTNVPKKELGRTVKLMEQNIKWAKSSHLIEVELEDVILRWCRLMKLSRNTSRAAKELAIAVKDKEGVHGKPCTTIAATAIFVITQLSEYERKPSADQMGKATGLAAETIKRTYRIISPHIADSLPKGFKRVEPATAGLALSSSPNTR